MDSGTGFERDARDDTQRRPGRGFALFLLLLALGGLFLAAASGARAGHPARGAARFDDDVGRSGRRW